MFPLGVFPADHLYQPCNRSIFPPADAVWQPAGPGSASQEHTLPLLTSRDSLSTLDEDFMGIQPGSQLKIPFPVRTKPSRPPAWFPVHPVCFEASKQSSLHISLGVCFPTARTIPLLPSWMNCLWRVMKSERPNCGDGQARSQRRLN